MTGRRQTRDSGPVLVLSRLLAALALALFGLSGGQAERISAAAGPAAESEIEQVQGVVGGQRHILRAAVPADDIADPVPPCAALPLPEAPATLRAVLCEHAPLRGAAVRILPPVRGPPAA